MKEWSSLTGIKIDTIRKRLYASSLPAEVAVTAKTGSGGRNRKTKEVNGVTFFFCNGCEKYLPHSEFHKQSKNRHNVSL
jgi:hypothetical protein